MTFVLLSVENVTFEIVSLLKWLLIKFLASIRKVNARFCYSCYGGWDAVTTETTQLVGCLNHRLEDLPITG